VSGLVEYVRGALPDRWHWMSSCDQFPRVVSMRRCVRPSSDLCDSCLDLERLEQKNAVSV
jgi:hypothetical protein